MYIVSSDKDIQDILSGLEEDEDVEVIVEDRFSAGGKMIEQGWYSLLRGDRKGRKAILESLGIAVHGAVPLREGRVIQDWTICPLYEGLLDDLAKAGIRYTSVPPNKVGRDGSIVNLLRYEVIL